MGSPLETGAGFEGDLSTGYSFIAWHLDGLTGTRPTSARFFSHVPEMRAQCVALYPASYFRVQEAYALQRDLDRRDMARRAFFYDVNTHLVMEQEQGEMPRRSPVSWNSSKC